MYKIRLKNVAKAHQYEELTKIFIKPEEFIIVLDEKDVNASNSISQEEFDNNRELTDKINKSFEFSLDESREQLAKDMFIAFNEEFGKRPVWGTLTGIRPVKLFGDLTGETGSRDKAKAILRDIYMVSDSKSETVADIYDYQMKTAGKAEKNSLGLYIGIPFCPTRCLYCSFTSNTASQDVIEKYLEALIEELDFVGAEMKERGLYAESVYIGGGTPTTLTAEQLDKLLYKLRTNVDLDRLKEITLEAGRPDTVTEEKLKTAVKYGVNRISINPQTMNDNTLKLIGRAHTADETIKAFELARGVGVKEINMDLITGLPGETTGDFAYTLDKVLSMSPENITVHTLAVKRASRLAEKDKNYHYHHADEAGEMMEYAYEKLGAEGYIPYYLYRQKHMTGAGENVGFCKIGTENLYNIRIMDEHQSILALGAGGVSKVYFPEDNRLERTANVSNYEIYMQRLEEMKERKLKNFFMEVEKC